MSAPTFTTPAGRYLWELSELKMQHQFATALLQAALEAEPEDSEDLETILQVEAQARMFLTILDEVLR